MFGPYQLSCHDRLPRCFPSVELTSPSHPSVSPAPDCMYVICLGDWLGDRANARSMHRLLQLQLSSCYALDFQNQKSPRPCVGGRCKKTVKHLEECVVLSAHDPITLEKGCCDRLLKERPPPPGGLESEWWSFDNLTVIVVSPYVSETQGMSHSWIVSSSDFGSPAEYIESIGDGKSEEYKEAERKRIMDLVDNF